MDIVLYGKDRNEIITSDVYELTELSERTTDDYALILTDNDIRTVAASHADTLEKTGRIEIMGGLVAKITEAFSTSPYFTQNNFADGLCRLIDAFYQTKNDCDDMISDDDLIEIMVTNFNEVYGGDIDALTENLLPRLSQMIRMNGIPKMNNDDTDVEREYD